MRFWDFSLAFYRDPTVQEACLAAQDVHGADVNVLLYLLWRAAGGEEVADFYEGQIVTILIGHPPGGSYDLYSQLAAEHLGTYIPGNPEVIVQQIPGGGGVTSTP